MKRLYCLSIQRNFLVLLDIFNNVVGIVDTAMATEDVVGLVIYGQDNPV